MAGSLSNIGLGSNGALSFDIIEKLRVVDERNQVAPIDRRLDTTSTKLTDLSILTTMVASFKSATSVLSDEMSYLKRSSSVGGDSVGVSVKSGTFLQDFSIDVGQLAGRDIIESVAFSSQNATFATAADTIGINIDGNDYNIDVNSNTTLTQLKDQIFDKTDGKVTASILNVGGADPYKLILKSTDTGVSQDITVSSVGGTVADLGLNDLNSAQDASFTYNGISIARASNSFDDLIVGVSITLKETGVSQVSITQDRANITKNLENFVSKYNELMSNLNEATKFDSDLKVSGIFQGTSEITGMKSMINRQLLSVDESGRNLADYGVTLNSGGMLELDKSIINSKLSSDSKDVESFFRGVTTVDTTMRAGSSVDAGTIDITAGDLRINGIDIIVSLTGTASQNAIDLRDAINSANISGIEVMLDSVSNRIILNSDGGGDIGITGDSAKLSSIGFIEGVTKGSSQTTIGFFSTFNDKLGNLISSKNSILNLFEQSLESRQKSLQVERETTVQRLDARYNIMATKFMAYDSIIGRLNNQFQSLSMMIEASFADKN
jgi:flagellar hook-associated protein 2